MSSSDLPCIAFRISAAASFEDELTGTLWDQGTIGIEIQPGNQDAVTLIAYFYDVPDLLDRLTQALPHHSFRSLEKIPVPDVDWVTQFKKSFRSFRVGAFWIAPPWELHKKTRGRLLVVDPGRAFGTGTHESTHLCLSALEERAQSMPLGRTLDLGTGSGILAIAATLLGACSVAAVDIDADSLESVARHGRLNHVTLHLVQSDGGQAFMPNTFDLIVANITARLLCDRKDEIVDLIKPGGTLILAGFLTADLPEIKEAYGGFGALEVRQKNDWAALIAHRKVL